MLEHLHAGEQLIEVCADDVLERHEPLVADVDEPREDRWHLDSREVLLAGVGVADRHRQVERQPRDVRERMRRVDRERRQHGEDPLGEEVLGGLLLVLAELIPAEQVDLGVAQRREDVIAEHLAVALHQLARLAPDRLKHLARHQAARSLHRDSGCQPPLEPRDPHHEELVEIAREDREEPSALEQRQALVLGQLEHPRVEPKPRHLAVEEPVVGKVGLLGLVRRLDVEDVDGRRVERSLGGALGCAAGRHGQGDDRRCRARVWGTVAVGRHDAMLSPAGEQRATNQMPPRSVRPTPRT